MLAVFSCKHEASKTQKKLNNIAPWIRNVILISDPFK